jgi:uroporphyrinogen decarboxylase
MNSRERFLAAARCQAVDRPPFWVMRQAGRYLPEYRELKSRHDFLTMVRTPELATEVTLQPLRRFPLDAAILFSDILITPEAMGLGYRFKETGGIAMEGRIASAADVERLESDFIPDRLSYVADALRLLRGELGPTKALLGFAGAPWTLAAYMVEGGSSENFEHLKGLFYGNRTLFNALMEKITRAVTALLKMQIEAGADAVQLFDSWAGACAAVDYEEASLKWTRQIIQSLGGRAPVILFARGAGARFTSLAGSGANVLGADWTVDLPSAAAGLPAEVAVQGNLDPVLLNGDPAIVARETRRLLESMRHRHGYIFNLGHGILPQARVESMASLSETVVNFSNL